MNTYKVKGGQILTQGSFAFEASTTFVTLHLTLPMWQKLFNSIKEWRRYGMFGVVFGDG
jgi:hypothetical protein